MRYTLEKVDLHELGDVLENLAAPRGLTTAIGAYQKAEARDRFTTQGEGEWAERAVPNIPGLIGDFARSAVPRAHRFESRPALIDKSNLVESIDFWHRSDDRVAVGSLLPYAQAMHDGEEGESDEITETVQSNLWTFLKSGKGLPWKEKLGFLLNKKFTGTTLTTRPRARPFFVFDEDNRKGLEESLAIGLRQPGGSLETR